MTRLPEDPDRQSLLVGEMVRAIKSDGSTQTQKGNFQTNWVACKQESAMSGVRRTGILTLCSLCGKVIVSLDEGLFAVSGTDGTKISARALGAKRNEHSGLLITS